MAKPKRNNSILLESDSDNSPTHETWSEIKLDKFFRQDSLPKSKPKIYKSFFPPDLLQSLPLPPPPQQRRPQPQPQPNIHLNKQSTPYIQNNAGRMWNMRFR
jgi:hypothetical protein